MYNICIKEIYKDKPILKMGNKNTEWSIGIWKDAQYCYSLEYWKLKPQ